MPEEYHIRTKKDYATSLIELLRKDDAIEDLELKGFELTERQKEAIEKELELINNNPGYLQKWDDVKQRYKKP